MSKKPSNSKAVDAFRHDESKRKNIPTAEHQSVVNEAQKNSKSICYPRNTDLDPQLVWRGKDEQDWSDLIIQSPPIYIQEKIHPKVLVDDLLRQSKKIQFDGNDLQHDLFGDFNGIPAGADKTEFYQHDQNWSNRMILGDSLQVMAGLAEREGLRGCVQCIYIDPPYGIKFNSNFQWSTTSRDVKDGKADNITREPEQVKAFRDTWRDGIHSYLTYLRDRLTVARDLLANSGSIFLQISEENLHRVRSLLDEIFGEENFISLITYRTSSGLGSSFLQGNGDYIIWYSKSKTSAKYRPLFLDKEFGEGTMFKDVEESDGTRRKMTMAETQGKIDPEMRPFRLADLVSSGLTPSCVFATNHEGESLSPRSGYSWKTNPTGMERLKRRGE